MKNFLSAPQPWKSVACPYLVIAIMGACWADDRPPISELSTSRLHLGFVPGDAFFAVRIEDSLSFSRAIPFESFGAAVPPDPVTIMELDYQYPRVRYVPSQQEYLGFAHLRIVDLTSEDSDILHEFDGKLRTEQGQIDIDQGRVPWWGDYAEPTPVPMVSIVVVNRDFDWRENHFYVRYNEDWNKERPTFWPGKVDVKRNHLLWPRTYQPHVVSAEAVLEDWTGGPRVAPLNVRLPDSATYENTDGRREVVEPVEVSFKEVAVVGFPTAHVRAIFSRPLNSTFFVATTEGVSRFRWVLEKGERVLKEEVLYKSEE